MANIALLVGDPTHASTTNLNSALTGLGHTVTVIDDVNVATADFSSFDLIASTRNTLASLSDIATRLRALGKPVLMGMLCEGGTAGTNLPDALGVTMRLHGNIDVETSTSDHREVNIFNINHSVTASYALGPITIYSGANFTPSMTDGAPLVGTVLAKGDPNSNLHRSSSQLIAIESGTPDLDGTALPMRIAVYGNFYAGQTVYTAEGNTLLGNIVNWLITAPAPLTYTVLTTPSETFSPYIEWSVFDNVGGTGIALGSGRVLSPYTEINARAYGDTGLVHGPNTRYLRLMDHAGNVSTTSFNVEAMFGETYEDLTPATIYVHQSGIVTLIANEFEPTTIYAELTGAAYAEYVETSDIQMIYAEVSGIGGMVFTVTSGEVLIDVRTSGIGLLGWLVTGPIQGVNATISSELTFNIIEVGDPVIIPVTQGGVALYGWLVTDPMFIAVEQSGIADMIYRDLTQEQLIEAAIDAAETFDITYATSEVLIIPTFGGMVDLRLYVLVRYDVPFLLKDDLYDSDVLFEVLYDSHAALDSIYDGDLEIF